MKWALLVASEVQQKTPMLQFKIARSPRQTGIVALLHFKMGIEGGLVRVSMAKVINAHNAARMAPSWRLTMETLRRGCTVGLVRTPGGPLATSMT